MYNFFIPFSLGLLIFLCGLCKLRKGIAALAEKKLEYILVRFTKTTNRSFLTGIISTACLQSSTAITVLTIGFVNAGVLSFTKSIGIILGSNIGTTFTTQLLTLKIEQLALPLITLGTIFYLIPYKKTPALGLAIIGFGALFLGINTMQGCAHYLEHLGCTEMLLRNSSYPILVGILIGSLFTALTHSSSATTAIAMGFYATGSTSLPLAIALVFGSNIGTCATGLVAAINTTVNAKRVALANFILNVGGVLIFIPFIPTLYHLAPYLTSDKSLQLAHIQTLFNIICSCGVLPFSHHFANFIKKFYKD
ncbi:MAG: hypothetical protein RLZ12_627 [Bacillota bacterium]